ncbi:MAG: hypothetical protein NW206_01560 [Hyphomonadaceae bacterium]|nr:hypothetical protein [Hyphomonadaceae bacterium]
MLRDDPAARKFESLFGPERGDDRPLERSRVRKALTALNSPQWNMPPTFHIAGGAGKGSTIAFMRAIAEAAGLTVHVFSAPHLLHLRERFRVAGALAETQQLIDLAERLSYLRVDLTNFEAQVVCAFSLFANSPADIAFIEAGDGGREDATNVIPSPVATILTTIDLHEPDLPHDRVVELARDRSGIMKGGVPMVAARQHEDVKLVLEQMAQRLGAPILGGGADWNAHAAVGSMSFHYLTRALDLPPPALVGAHQIDNAGLAAATLLTWGDRRITPLALATGMTSAQCRGRLEPITSGGLHKLGAGAELWVDCGQSAQAASALALALRDMARRRPARTVAVLGIEARSGWRGFVERVAPEVDAVVAAALGPGGVDPSAIEEIVNEGGVASAKTGTLRGAISCAVELGAGRILICGSCALAGQALQDTRPIN